MFPQHETVETINFVVGIPLNAFLLYLIHRFSRKELGAYKHLLTIFAVHDIFLSIVEALLSATAVRVGSIISIVCRTFWESRHIACAYVAFYTLPLILTNLNFLYRYWAIKSPGKLVLYTRKGFQGATCAIIASGGAGWYLTLYLFTDGRANDPTTILLRNWYNDKFNLTLNDGWIVLDYWPDGVFALRPFLVLVFGDTMLLIQLATAVYLSTMTFYHIHDNKAMSENSRAAQKRVLIALCAQTTVPLLCVHFPYVSNLNTPFFGIDSFLAPELSASFVSAFPLWDAIVIILMMRDYRVGALSLVYGRKSKKGTTSHMFTTCVSVEPSHIITNQQP